MKKYLFLLELKSDLLEINQKKGLPIQILSTPTQTFVKFKVIRDFGGYRRQFTYNKNPYELLKDLNCLPDLTPKYNWSLLGKFL